ncbi:MAG: hypothetical protein FJX76_04015 [Armatimonadetes bacterium]|nr:hypothetical protein [Armatimonadota bacterium]
MLSRSLTCIALILFLMLPARGSELNFGAIPWDLPYVADFSPNGRVLAVAQPAKASSVMLWDLQSGKLLGLLGKGDHTTSLQFSKDGKRIAQAVRGGALRVWQVGSGKKLWEARPAKSWGYYLSFSYDGQYLKSRGLGPKGDADTFTRVFDASNGHRVLDMMSGRFPIRWTPDNRLMRVGGDTITLFAPTRKGRAKGLVHDTPVEDLAFSDGRRFVVTLTYPSKLLEDQDRGSRLWAWDLQEGRLLKTLALQSKPRGLRIAPTSNMFAVLYADKSEIWQIDEKGAGFAADVAGEALFAPQDTAVVTVDDEGVDILSPTDFKPRAHIDGAANVTFSPDGQRMLLFRRGGGVATLWDLASGQKIAQSRERIDEAVFTPDSAMVLAGLVGSGDRCWDIPGTVKAGKFIVQKFPR